MEEKHCWDDLLTETDRIVIERVVTGSPEALEKSPYC